MKIRKPAAWALGAFLALGAFAPMPAQAQDTSTVPLPRNNVTGGSLSERRPGLWVQSGVSTTSDRISTAITNYGGVEYTNTDPSTSFRDEILPALVDGLVSLIEQLALVIQTLLGTTTS